MTTEQFDKQDNVLAVVSCALENGEAFIGPIAIGFYSGSDGEIWLQQEGRRVQVPKEQFKEVAREMARALKAAVEDAAKAAAEK